MYYGSYFVSDISVAYAFDSGVSVSVGVDNVFDRDLPGVTTGTGAGSASYDNIGRFYYSSIAYRF